MPEATESRREARAERGEEGAQGREIGVLLRAPSWGVVFKVGEDVGRSIPYTPLRPLSPRTLFYRLSCSNCSKRTDNLVVVE